MQALSLTELMFYLFVGAMSGYFSRVVVGGTALVAAFYFIVGYLLELIGWHSIEVNWQEIFEFFKEICNYILVHANRFEVLSFFPAFYFGYRRGLFSGRHKNGNGNGNGHTNGNGFST